MRAALNLVLAALLAGCSDAPPKPAGTLYYKISGQPGTPVVVEYNAKALKPGDRDYGRDVIRKEEVLPKDGFLRFWGDAVAGGTATMNGRTRDPNMRSCVKLEIQVDDRTLREAESCMVSFTEWISATVPTGQ